MRLFLLSVSYESGAIGYHKVAAPEMSDAERILRRNIRSVKRVDAIRDEGEVFVE